MTEIHVGTSIGSTIVGRDVHGDVSTHSTNAKADLGGISLVQLADELATLRNALRQEAKTDEQDEAVVAIGKAAKAVQDGNNQGVLEALKAAGKWAFDVATKIGVSVAADALKVALGLP